MRRSGFWLSGIWAYVLPSEPLVRSDHLPGPSLRKKGCVYLRALDGVESRHLRGDLLPVDSSGGHRCMSLSLEAGRAAGRVTYPERVFAFSTTSCFLPASHPYLKARFLSVFIPTRVSRIPITSDCLSDSLALKQLYCLSFPYSLWGSEFSGCLQHVVRTRTIGNSCAP